MKITICGIVEPNAVGTRFPHNLVERLTSARPICHFLRKVCLALLFLFPVTAWSQTLDEAVKAQLEVYNNEVCGRLLQGDDPSVVLTGPLAGPTLCRRNPPAGSSTTTSSTAGSATPTTITDIAKKRFEEETKESKSSKSSSETESTTSSEQGPTKGGFFITAENESLNRDVTRLEDGYDSSIQKSTIGADYRFNYKSFAGVALELSQQYIDFNAGGDSDVKTNGLVAYGSYAPTDKFVMQMYGGYSSKSYKRNRIASFVEYDQFGGINTDASGVPHADFDASQYGAGAQLAYDVTIGRVSLGPSLSIDWLNTDFGTYKETGDSGLELTFHDDKVSSLQSSASLEASLATRAGSWVLIPQLGINWKHEFENNQRTIQVSFVGDIRSKLFSFQTDAPDRDWLEFNVGIVAIPGKYAQIFANYRAIAGHDYFKGHTISLGVRVPF